MEIRLAESYGFCFGVKRAISIAEDSKNASTIGPLIHNNEEIKRLKENFNVDTEHDLKNINKIKKAIIRTHGIPKNDLAKLIEKNIEVINATCPFVTKPQQICEQMSKEGYDIVIFGDINHPEVKGVMSYALKKPIVVLNTDELKDKKFSQKVAVVSQTTKKPFDFLKIVNYLIVNCKEVRVFNTICNATFDNQDAARKLSKEADVMIVIGGKNSSNTKQLFSIAKENCCDSYLIENEKELSLEWFKDKKICGITAGASTPEWMIKRVIEKIKEFIPVTT